MDHPALIRMILSRQPADRCGFWLGMPVEETRPMLCDYL
jgi:hypothetical protein